MLPDAPGISGEAVWPFRSLELTARGSYDASALAQLVAGNAKARRVGENESVRLYGPPSNADSGVDFTWRIWWALPDWWRDDLTWPNGHTTVIIVRPGASLASVSMQETLYTSEPAAPAPRGHAQPSAGMHLPTVADRLAEFPLLRPPLPSSEWEVVTLGHEVYNGREVRRVRATRRSDVLPVGGSGMSGYWPVVGEYECLVDDALRILVRFSGIAGGVPVAVISADEVRADAPLPAEIFTFSPRAGTRIVPIVRAV